MTSEILIMNLFLAGSGLVLACLGVCYKRQCKKISYDPETPNELKTYYTVTFADGQMWNRKGTLTRVD